MKSCKIIAATLCTAAAIGLCGCVNSTAPVSVSKSTYTGLDKTEHQLLPEGMKFLSLETAQDLAIQNNPSFRSAYFAIAAARAQYYSTFSYYMPTVTVEYDLRNTHSWALNDDAGNYNSMSLNSTPAFTAKWLIFDSLQREMNVIAARHNWKSTEASERDARRILLRSVAYAYNEIMLAKAKINIALENMNYNRELLKETELKFGVGAAPLSDVLNFKIEYNTGEGNLYTAQYSYQAAKYALAKLMGLTEGTIPDEVKFPEMPSSNGELLADVNVYLDMALANRPDLKKYREALEAAKYKYYSSIAAFGPNAYATASGKITTTNGNQYGRNGYSDYHYSPDTSSLNYGILATWEIFSGGRTYFAMRAAQATMEQADLTLADTWIGVVTDVRTSYDNYVKSLKQVKLYQKTLEITRKTRDLVSEEYNAGSTDITRMNDAQRRLVEAQTNLVSAVVNMHNASAQLKAATNSL